MKLVHFPKRQEVKEWLVQHLGALPASTVVLVLIDLTYEDIKDRLPQGKKFVVLDTISWRTGKIPTVRPQGVYFIDGHTRLEFVLKRVDNILHGLGEGAHVVLESACSLSRTHTPQFVAHFAHMLRTHVGKHNATVDVLRARDDQDEELSKHLAYLIEEVHELAD